MSTNVLRQCEALEGLADVPSSSIPLVVTSPPWGKTRTFGGHQFDFEPVAAELWRVISQEASSAGTTKTRSRMAQSPVNTATNFCISDGWDSASTRPDDYQSSILRRQVRLITY